MAKKKELKLIKKHSGKIFFLDTETGGSRPGRVSLFSIGLVKWEKDRVGSPIEILIKNDILQITPEALLYNEANIKTYLKGGITQAEAVDQVIKFVRKGASTDGPITLAGHNINFDIWFLRDLFDKQGLDFYKYFSYRFIDTAAILQYLILCEKLPPNVDNLDRALTHFGIQVKNRHSAADDALVTAVLFSKLVELGAQEI